MNRAEAHEVHRRLSSLTLEELKSLEAFLYGDKSCDNCKHLNEPGEYPPCACCIGIASDYWEKADDSS